MYLQCMQLLHTRNQAASKRYGYVGVDAGASRMHRRQLLAEATNIWKCKMFVRVVVDARPMWGEVHHCDCAADICWIPKFVKPFPHCTLQVNAQAPPLPHYMMDDATAPFEVETGEACTTLEAALWDAHEEPHSSSSSSSSVDSSSSGNNGSNQTASASRSFMQFKDVAHS